MNKTSFKYDPLPANQIRVLRLIPGTSKRPLRCELHTKSLRGVHDSYDALSYVWGPESQLKQIFVNEKPFWIRKNLWEFLRTIRSKIGNSTIWVDAICIDQFNLQERAQQVQIMGDIYREAGKVVVWLGKDAGQIGSIARLWNQEFFLEKDLCVEDERFQKFCGRLDGGRDFVTDALHQFLSNEYWTRAWIVPEIILSGNVDVWCRWKSMWEEWECEAISLERLVQMYLLLGQCFNVKTKGIFSASAKIVDLVACKRLLMHQSEGRNKALKMLNLGSLLIQFGANQCTDLRDRVYSLAGLTLRLRPDICDPEMKMANRESEVSKYQNGIRSIIGNYSISCRELFIQVLRIDRPRFVADMAGPLWGALDLNRSWSADPAEFANDHFVIEVARHKEIHCVQDGFAVDNEQKMRLSAFNDSIRNGDFLFTFVQNLSLREKDAFSSQERLFGLQSELFLVIRLVSNEQATHNLSGRRRLDAVDLKVVGVAVDHDHPQPASVECSRSGIQPFSILEFATQILRGTTLNQGSRPDSSYETDFYATLPLTAMILLQFGPSATWHWRDRRGFSNGHP